MPALQPSFGTSAKKLLCSGLTEAFRTPLLHLQEPAGGNGSNGKGVWIGAVWRVPSMANLSRHQVLRRAALQNQKGKSNKKKLKM